MERAACIDLSQTEGQGVGFKIKIDGFRERPAGLIVLNVHFFIGKA